MGRRARLYIIYIKSGSWPWGLKEATSPPWEVPGSSRAQWGYSNDHNSAVISSKLMILFFPESSHRAAARGTVPDWFRLIPDDFLMKIQFFSQKITSFCK